MPATLPDIQFHVHIPLHQIYPCDINLLQPGFYIDVMVMVIIPFPSPPPPPPWFHLVRPSVRLFVRLSVCGQDRVHSVSSIILIRSISYLHILSSNFRRSVTCNVCFKFHKFVILANSFNFWLWLCLLLTLDPIWLNSMGNHEAAGVILRMQAS